MTDGRPLVPATMPPLAPLAFPAQRLDRGPKGRADGVVQTPVAVRRARWLVFAPAAAMTGALMGVFLDWFSMDGINAVEALLAALIGFGVFWSVLSLCSAILGAVGLAKAQAMSIATLGKPVSLDAAKGLDVALVMPIYNEAPHTTFGNAAAMMEALATRATPHRFTLYMLSDTRDADVAFEEERAFAHVRASLPDGINVYYRRRSQNTDRKVGNIADWVTHWGAAHPAMLVLDADSLMGCGAIIGLADALAADPKVGLIQSLPQLIGARSLFARAQEFSNTVYGAALAQGLAQWTGQEGNYWGHNAILRTRAFAASAGLPKLGGDRLILSHDFVEAGLLRRAGWSVRFLPQIAGSWEETPATLLDHVARDRRWCQGNLQHLRLLRAKGFHTLSRFHLFQGAVGYLLSPLWFVLLIVWTLIGPSQETSVIAYFSPEMPLRPTWPEMAPESHLWVMALIYALLLAPKLVGAAMRVGQVRGVKSLGGAGSFGVGLVTEILLSILYAPVLMIQQTKAVVSVLIGLRVDWTPQPRENGGYAWRDYLRGHCIETLLGLALTAGLALGLVSLWLVPIAGSLLLAVPLSWLSGVTMSERFLATPQSLRVPIIRRAALHWQDRLRRLGTTPAE